jgi:hypothetical protein
MLGMVVSHHHIFDSIHAPALIKSYLHSIAAKSSTRGTQKHGGGLTICTHLNDQGVSGFHIPGKVDIDTRIVNTFQIFHDFIWLVSMLGSKHSAGPALGQLDLILHHPGQPMAGEQVM